MSSFVRRLAKSFSLDTPPSSASWNPSDQGITTSTPTPIPRRFSASPSFNDFSLNVQDEFEDELGAVPITRPPLTTNDSVASSPATSAASTPKQKIAGMDPYDFCDLLKSSSL